MGFEDLEFGVWVSLVGNLVLCIGGVDDGLGGWVDVM